MACVNCKCDNIEPGTHACAPLHQMNDDNIKKTANVLTDTKLCNLVDVLSFAWYGLWCLQKNIIAQLCWLTDKVASLNLDKFLTKDQADKYYQSKLKAGDGISISSDGTVSNTRTYKEPDLSPYLKTASADAKYQVKLKQGDNIKLNSDGTISAVIPSTDLSGYLTKALGDQYYQQKLTAGRNITISGNTINANIDLSDYVTKAEYNALATRLNKIIANLEASGAWTGGANGNFVSGRNIATGNINIFGGTPDGNSFIRTNSGKTENDLAGGI